MIKAFACYNKNDKIRMKSSSGGVYYLIAEKIVTLGGVVYGAYYDGVNVVHRRIDTLEGIENSCGSKYQPSNLHNIFRQVQDDLKNQQMVLFTGTPCQCSGLLSFVGQYGNLYVSDCVCHGIPSKRAWREYLVSMKKNGMEIASVNMRDKVSGWPGYSWRLTGTNGKEVVQPQFQNQYMKGFISDLYLRPSCYECVFKGLERRTDFTLGDYWGVQVIQPEMFDGRGTSLVFIHTDKGIALFREVADRLQYTDADLERAIQANPSIVKVSARTVKRVFFFQRLDNGEDFIEIVNDLTKLPLYKRAERKVKMLVEKICPSHDLMGGGVISDSIIYVSDIIPLIYGVAV